MKYIVLLCDGMADLPIGELGGKTPMQAAKKPFMDRLARVSALGMVKTVPDGMSPGSDVANLAVLGYDPRVYYSGRSPLEAMSIGIEMKSTDVSLRCNLVTLSGEADFMDKTMLDYCAGDISTDEARLLVSFLDERLGAPPFRFYSGISYRHCLIWDKGTLDLGELTPPHDITGQPVRGHLRVNEAGRELFALMERAHELLKNHPVNIRRMQDGKRPANGIWLWGEGVRRELPTFTEKTGKKGAVISAVDLLKGIGKFTKMEVLEVVGATGYLDTNFAGKTDAAVRALRGGCDLAYIHIEAPDECGHRGELAEKIRAIELIDERVLGPLLEAFSGEDVRLLICPDHPTPVELRTHTSAAVPYLLYDSRRKAAGGAEFSEESAAGGAYVENGYTLMEKLLSE